MKPRPLVEKLEKERLSGVRFRPLYFQPVLTNGRASFAAVSRST